MKKLCLMLASVLPLYSCSHYAPMATVEYVDLDRFMGDWYVIASIPTFLEEGAHNAIESYQQNEDGTIETTFTFLDGGFDGERKEYHPTGFIRDTETNALWGMQFIWPIKADYRIVYLDDAYTNTVIAREARDYVWLMSRDPDMSDTTYESIVRFIGDIGYDISKLERVPHRWPDQPVNKTDMEHSS